jgi:hypothetical protein
VAQIHYIRFGRIFHASPSFEEQVTYQGALSRFDGHDADRRGQNHITDRSPEKRAAKERTSMGAEDNQGC